MRNHFSLDADPDVAAFELSWQAAFAATSETSGHIAANVGGFTLDLEALDLDNS